MLMEENVMNFKATELRLGLPGFESPHNKEAVKVSWTKTTKRVFSDTTVNVDTGKWVFAKPEDKLNNGFKGIDQNGNETVFLPNAVVEKKTQVSAAKAQVVGWPPIRSFRKNSMANTAPKNNEDADNKAGSGCLYVKVSMDGAPYLRKVDLKTYKSYSEMSSALEKMFSCFTIGHCGSHGGASREGLSKSRLMDLVDGSEYVLTYEDKDGDWMLVGDVPWALFTGSCRRMRIMKSSDAVGLAPRAT